MSSPSEVQIAWLAGLLEGEGCFTCADGGRRVEVYLKMTDVDVVLKASKLMSAPSVRRRKVEDNKDAYVTRVTGPKAVAVMQTVLPYMGARRTERIKGLLGNV